MHRPAGTRSLPVEQVPRFGRMNACRIQHDPSGRAGDRFNFGGAVRSPTSPGQDSSVSIVYFGCRLDRPRQAEYCGSPSAPSCVSTPSSKCCPVEPEGAVVSIGRGMTSNWSGTNSRMVGIPGGLHDSSSCREETSESPGWTCVHTPVKHLSLSSVYFTPGASTANPPVHEFLDHENGST